MALRRAPSLREALHGARAEAAAQAERWFLWSPVAFGGGAAIYIALHVEPPLWLGAVLAALAMVLTLAVARWSGSRATMIAGALLTFLAAGFLAAELRTAAVAAPVLWDRADGEVDGWVIDVAGPGSGGGRLLIAPYHIDGVAPVALPASVRITVGPDALIGPGSAVRLRASLGPPPEPASPGAYDFARDSYFQRVGAVGFVLSAPQVVSGPRPPPLLGLRMAVNAARWALARRIIDELGPREGGVAVAMTTGHEAWLDPKQVAAMRDSGLAHILSISGVHMAIVGGFVFALVRLAIALWPWLALRVNGKKIAAGAGLVAVAVYLVVSGAPPPAVRSAVTLSVAFIAVLADRRAITLHALAVAALIVLALQPEAVVQPGFQMSFAATAALIALAEIWPQPVKEINTPWPIRLVQGAGVWLAASIAASLVAGAATSPFAIQHFNRVSIYGLPANMVMAPLSSFVIMPALAAGALLEALGGIGGWLLQAAAWGIGLLDQLARLFAGLPHATMTVASAPAFTLPLSFLGLLFLCLWKGRLRWLGVPAALAVSFWPRPAAPVAWIASDGGAAAVVQGRTAVYLRPGVKQFAADLWTRRRGLLAPKDVDAAQAAMFDCNRRRCLPTAAAPIKVAALWSRRPPSTAESAVLCRDADMVVIRGKARPGCPGALVLNGDDFARGGAAEVYAARGGWRVEWANDARGVRPWTAPRL